MKNRALSLFLAFLLLAAVLSGCAQTNETAQPTPASQTETSTSAETAAPAPEKPDAVPEKTEPKTITIIDHTGAEVTIPADIQRVAIDQVPLYATYVMYMGGTADKLAGMAAAPKKVLSKSLIMKIAPEIADVSTQQQEEAELNVEELLNLEPDVVLYNASNAEHAELFRKAGIPAVGFNTINTTADPIEIYTQWLRLLEQVFQEPGKMDDAIAYGEELIKTVEERTSTIPESERKNVLILFNFNNGTPSVSGAQKHFGAQWLAHAGVNNAAAEVVGVTEANLEQIYTWDPDLIIMPGPGQCKITPKQVLENSVEGADFSPLRAVKEGQVFSNSLGMWSWYIPSSDAPLVLFWIAQLSYPELFPEDIREITREYYHNYYDYDLSEEELDFVFDRSVAQ